MTEIICHTPQLPEGEELNISFMDLLLDDTLANGRLEFPETLYNEIGAFNTRLTAKQSYEFLLRAARKYPVRLIGTANSKGISTLDTVTDSSDNVTASAAQTSLCDSADRLASFYTDCYVAGKYQQDLLESGYFDPVMETLLAAASDFPDSQKAIHRLEQMISHAPEYYEIDDNTRPILIYRGSDTCYNTLNSFADELAQAFIKSHQRVEILDLEKEGNHALLSYINRRFKAIIGIQTYAFSIMMQDKTTNLHDLISGPKFNMILDHPAWLKEHIENAPKEYYLLIHDRNYLSFAKQYYPKVTECIYFPPGGKEPAAQTISIPFKQYDLTFIGSYRDYRERLALIHTYDRQHRFFAARYLKRMKEHPELPAEQAFRQVLADSHLELNDTDFLNLFYEMRQSCFCIMLYYREKVVQTLLDAGITVHVYSDSWQKAPFAGHPCLIIHPALDIADSLIVMQQSRLSLNVMSWHKDGLTERILNAMLCQSVVLSDKSSVLEEEFADGIYSVLFDLKELEKLPAIVKNILEDETLQNTIASNACRKAKQEHLWQHRSELLLKSLE